jgi:hypothetical protein
MLVDWTSSSGLSALKMLTGRAKFFILFFGVSTLRKG